MGVESLMQMYEREQAYASMFQDGDDGGQEVAFSDAMECIGYYNAEMAKRGIIEKSIPFDLPVCVDERQDITYFVKFDGFKLKEWILKEFRQAPGINFKIACGMYTERFLLEYFPNDPAARAAKLKRISLFIMPYFKDISKAFQLLGDGKAYNLGGLEP
ncbi:hypothetical protein [uncultured Chitinophaga sp.]|uniref:hypothetical protein n=1 Tax=uncultured Chitinophaga sp. TaxID=339340 RepID=UPI0026288630|nr:hypothetical protein [uncultured Chitinophaga sp.]